MQTPTTAPVISQSDLNLSYEIPDTSPDPNFDKEARDAIDAIARETEGDRDADLLRAMGIDPDNLEDVPADEEGAPLGDEPAGGGKPAEKPVEKQEEDLDDPRLARGIERLVSRERAAVEAETRAKAEQAKLEGLIAQYSKFKDLAPSAELSERSGYDALGVIKALTPDPDAFIRLAMAQNLGDEAPAELKKFASDAANKREAAAARAEVAQLRKELEQRDLERRATEYRDTIHRGAREYVNTVGESTPTLARIAKANPERAHAEIWEEILRDSQTRAATDPTGEPMSYEEAAKRVESRLSVLYKMLVPDGTPAIKNARPPAAPPPSTKPAPAPLPSWRKQTSDLEEQGIKEALREYARVEQLQRAGKLY